MKVDYISHMGDDLLVANAARVSLNKHHTEFMDNDAKLISYLAQHGHWTPFSHPTICLRITVPIFVANQLKRHTVGLTLNEVSRRYVDDPPEYYITSTLGKRAPNKKQGALENEYIDNLDGFLANHYEVCTAAYNELLRVGVAPEDARMVLPLATYTSWYWTGSLYAYSRIYKLRNKPDAQRQTQEVSRMIGHIMDDLFPVSWKALI